ncbi:MAG: hypothetical protein IPK99_05115 [Flavobacteriales bacterium]|nr:hypothetical protein [Flavobacteriales bacterium]
MNTFVLTITNDDTTPTVQFSTWASRPWRAAGAEFPTEHLPTSPAAQTATINISNGVGANYTTDYVTNPNGGGTITVNIPPTLPVSPSRRPSLTMPSPK